jgi:hypothetical protein
MLCPLRGGHRFGNKTSDASFSRNNGADGPALIAY